MATKPIKFLELLYTMTHLAYGGWARSTIGSQNFGVLTKRYDNTITAFFFAANKNKNSEQVPLTSTSS